MTSEHKNKDNIISENHPEEVKNFGEEGIKDKKFLMKVSQYIIILMNFMKTIKIKQS